MRVEFEITGLAPLIMQSDRLADPFDSLTKEHARLARKRTKAEDDHQTLARMEFYAGLYHDPELGPYLPPENLHKCLREAAGLVRRGQEINRSVLITERLPLQYEGPRDVESLWRQEGFRFSKTVVNAGQSRGRVVRMRPIFRQWGVAGDLELIDRRLDLADLRSIAEEAGTFIGLGSWRPRYGRFSVRLRKGR